MPGLANLVPVAWRAALAGALPDTVDALLRDEPGAVFPPREQIFAALEHTPPDDVRVVLLGQDPYPTRGNANGLAFSVTSGVKIPASLRNLFKALAADLGTPAPTTGDLTPWTRSGVLLLNTVLTVREGEAGSHRKRGWESFTMAVLREVVRRDARVVFLALGKHAQQMLLPLVDGTRHAIIALPHPSPLNGNAFVDAAKVARPFSRANALLLEAGREAVDWTLS
ncbi:MAG: uracil-DNA glycosylase [Polyangia bacterium]